MRLPRWTLATVTLLLALGTAACSDGLTGQPEPTGTPTAAPTPTPTSDFILYELPEHLCEAIDLTPLTQLYPVEQMDSVLRVSSEDDCETALDGPQGTLSVSVDLFRTDDVLMQNTPVVVKQFYDFQRAANSAENPTDIDGVGTEAFWWTDGKRHQIYLETYDGNINAHIWVFAVGGDHTLAQDMTERVAAVAASIFTRLAPN